ncbi:MAG: hypothetical protein Q8Q15_01150 [bacterium]|nr:hypothetical protein [bacterium]
MKKLLIIFLLLIPVIAGLFLLAQSRENKQVEPEIVSENKVKSFPAQTSDEGQVVVDVQPKLLEVGKEAVFEVTFTTHSVELDFDLASVSRLKDDQGKELNAVSWTGGKGGHHLSGELSFPKISDKAKSVELIISNISENDRSFGWDL